MKFLTIAVLLMLALCGCHLVSPATTYRIDFSPGYAYVISVKGSQPRSIYVAEITDGKLKRIPQTVRLKDSEFTILCTMTSKSLTGFASLQGEITMVKDGVPVIGSLRGELVGDKPSMKKEPNQAPEPTAPSGRGSS